MYNIERTNQQQNVKPKRPLHLYATQRVKPRFGSGMASVDIHAWLLTLALAFLLREDPNSWLPPQLGWPAGHEQVASQDVCYSSQ